MRNEAWTKGNWGHFARVVGLLSSLGSCGSEDAAEPIVGEAEFAIGHYDYQFSMDSREARATLRLTLASDGDCVTIPMRSTGLRDVTIDDEPALLAEIGSGNARTCGEGWPAGTELQIAAVTTVELDTWKSSQVGYSVTEDIEGNPFTYLVSWVGGCDRFAPCDSRASAFATYRFTIDHPADQTILCPGTITAGDTQTICEFSHSGGPTYSSFGFAAS